MSVQINQKNYEEQFEKVLTQFLLQFDVNKNNNAVKDMESCIEFGVDLNKNYTTLGKTPLSVAITKVNTEAVNLFLKHGSNPNKPNVDRSIPLELAIKSNKVDIVKLLINHGVNVCKVDKNGKCPLSLAAEQDNLELVQVLIKNGAKFNLQSSFIDIINTKSISIVEHFIKCGAVLNFRYKTPVVSTPLIAAIKTRKLELVKILVSKGADVNLTDLDGETPLLTAIGTERLDIVHFLLDNGALVDEANSNGSLPLMTAIYLENFPIVLMLVGKNVNLNRLDQTQEYPLTAAAKKHIRIFEFLINVGADIELARQQLEAYATENEDFRLYWTSNFNLIMKQSNKMSDLNNKRKNQPSRITLKRKAKKQN